MSLPSLGQSWESGRGGAGKGRRLPTGQSWEMRRLGGVGHRLYNFRVSGTSEKDDGLVG